MKVKPYLVRWMAKAVLVTAILGVGLVMSANRLQAQAHYEPYTFTTLAGGGGSGSADGTGSGAQFNGPGCVAADGSGNVYVGDIINNTIRKITAAGVVTTLAGMAGESGSDDGTGSGALFNGPYGVAVDSSGNIYVADQGNSTIRKITAAGVVTTLAGLAGTPGNDNGTGSAARFSGPVGVAVDSAGNVYVADQGNNSIRKITPAGVVTTLASGIDPAAVAVDGAGNVYVPDPGNSTILKVTSIGAVSTLAGSAGNQGSADGTGSAARFNVPTGVAVDGSGNVYVADANNSTIRKITPAGLVTTLAGLALATGNDDGTGSGARFYDPVGVAVDGSGNVYVADFSNNNIRKGAASGNCPTITLSPATLPKGAVGVSYNQVITNFTVSTWATTGEMINWRERHRAILLPNGKVLVVGGLGTEESGLPSGETAELYDPVTRMWTLTGAMTTPLAYHTATLLPNGKVLAAGGGSGISSAELYDPTTGAWTATGDMIGERDYHTATLLPNGKVLVTGGFLTSELSSTELYDPTSGTWTATGNMVSERLWHTATLLPNGKVLVAGGLHDAEEYHGFSGAELYDPTTGIWTATGSMITGRLLATATLLPNGKVLVTGGDNATNSSPTAELYDPATGIWTATGSMIQGRHSHAAILLPQGKVMVTGGYFDNNEISSSAELYDPASGTWTAIEAMPTGHFRHTATLLPDGNVLVVGGLYSSSAELYQPANGGLAPFTYAVTSGSVPSGLFLASNGSLSGTPTVLGTNTFTVTATDFNGCTGSQSYSVVITAKPAIITQPSSRTNAAGTTAMFTVAAVGTPTLTYQWQKSSVNISGATASSYALTNVQTINGGLYRAIVRNGFGSVTSSVVTLAIVAAPPTITSDGCFYGRGEGNHATYLPMAEKRGERERRNLEFLYSRQHSNRERRFLRCAGA
jgi:hypothetical protein